MQWDEEIGATYSWVCFSTFEPAPGGLLRDQKFGAVIESSFTKHILLNKTAFDWTDVVCGVLYKISLVRPTSPVS
jgi:hypothetical protein